MNEQITGYFGGERAAGLLFICFALVAIELAVTFWRKSGSPRAKGAAAALVMVAAIQLAVGATVFLRSPHDQARVSAAVANDLPHVRSHEVPRMSAVMERFSLYRWVELGVLALGALLALLDRRNTWVRGFGVGLLPQAAAMLLLDELAAKRGEAYLAWLRTL
jgi:hypothetical protein